jgi:hypothetical protein
MNKLETTKNKVKTLLPNGWTINNAMGLSLTGQHTPEYLRVYPETNYKNNIINSLPKDFKKEAFEISNVLWSNSIKHHLNRSEITILT